MTCMLEMDSYLCTPFFETFKHRRYENDISALQQKEEEQAWLQRANEQRERP